MSGNSEDVTVHVESYAFQVIGLDAREYHFGPDGLQFTPAATLMLDGDLFMNADGSPATEILWLYYNPHTNHWQLQNSITKHANGNFYIPVGHFSIYRAVTKSGVSISQGGQSRPNNK